ncbi:hypothetical protein ONV78_19575 [Hahella sp. CR1]|uniref:hypothetical protein n=1 Tax=Hahella sp. CR1 TaxID=2992807 RepID=UPI002442F8B7|nr:hypothetical protein [Hahella sp. CR1]MDG9669946.1 hypothetical protein [Hahella sp. CR1]
MVDVEFYFNTWLDVDEKVLLTQIESLLGVVFKRAEAGYAESNVLGARLYFGTTSDLENCPDLPFSSYRFVIGTDSKSILTRTMIIGVIAYISTLMFKSGVSQSGMMVFDGQVLIESWSFGSKIEAFDKLDLTTKHFDQYIGALIQKCGDSL